MITFKEAIPFHPQETLETPFRSFRKTGNRSDCLEVSFVLLHHFPGKLVAVHRMIFLITYVRWNLNRAVATETRVTRIDGVLELTAQRYSDHRGAFLNAYRAQESSFEIAWGGRSICQVNISCTPVVGAVRGMHMQAPPHGEAKLVRCLRGRVWDVAVDLRFGSPTFGEWHAAELSPGSGNSLLIPEGCAHGFQVLEPDSELLYLHSGPWVPESETGVRFDDPQLAVSWPLPPLGLSERDLSLPLLESLV